MFGDLGLVFRQQGGREKKRELNLVKVIETLISISTTKLFNIESGLVRKKKLYHLKRALSFLKMQRNSLQLPKHSLYYIFLLGI